jgi:DNA-binding NtrC family response regulator
MNKTMLTRAIEGEPTERPSGRHRIEPGAARSPTGTAGGIHPVRLRVLLVDDDDAIRSSFRDVLLDAGHEVLDASDGAEALALIEQHAFDVAICDVCLPKVDGLTVFRRLRQDAPQTVVILMTGHADVHDAVASLQEGAADYVTKPVAGDALMMRIDHVAERLALRRELEIARNELIVRDVGCAIIGQSPTTLQLMSRIDTLAQSHASVVITGESGTGKELVARTIHARGPRHEHPFVAVNCAAFPETLLEAELFGHEQGAFTGATRKRDGRFVAADGGTLLLDEVGEMPLSAQVKLLRVLQEGTVEPLGAYRPINVDVRIIAATHRNLREMVAAGRFREDLFFRLNVIELNVPPLRERKGDFVPLLVHFLRKYMPRGKVPPAIAPRAWAALSEYAYPGNVREFGHAIEHGLVLCRGREIDLEHLPPQIACTVMPSSSPGESFRPLSLAKTEFEREYLLRALRICDGGRAQAAELLNISRKNLWERLRRHNITDVEAALERRFSSPSPRVAERNSGGDK